MSPSEVESEETWPAEWLEAISDASLIKASSSAIFARAKEYANSESIEITDEAPYPEPTLWAQVLGTHRYETSVWIEADRIAGECDCPNAQDGWFCKHQVALAMVWRESLASNGASVGAAQARRASRQERRQSLEEFLYAQDARTLADKLLSFAEHDRQFASALRQWHKHATARGTPAELKSLITDALEPQYGYMDYGQIAAYVQRAESVILLLEQACERDPQSAVELAIHALRCGWQTIEQADDSDGEISGLCMRYGEELLEILQTADDQPEAFGKTYLQLILEDPIGCFDAAAIEEAIGPAALESYRRTLASQWRKGHDKYLAERAKAKKTPHKSYELSHLQRLHLAELERAGEVESVLDVLKEDLTDAGAYETLARFLERHGRQREAFAAAEAAYRKYPDNWRAEATLLEFYQRDGWHREAFELLEKRFGKSPDLSNYQNLIQAAQTAGEDVAQYRESVFKRLIAREKAEMKATGPSAKTLTKSPRVTLRAKILASEKRWLEALEIVQPPAYCEAAVLRDIALHLPKSHQAEAVALLKRIFEALMQTASTPYREPLELVGQIIKRQDAATRRAWLADLRTRFKLKRNFIRDLPAA
jgi:uncharacterized Zn finger protein